MGRARTPIATIEEDDQDEELLSTEEAEDPEGRRHEVLGILAGASTLMLALSLFSYDARGGENWIGPVGASIAELLATAFGFVAWLVPLELALLTSRLFRRTTGHFGIARAASTLVFLLLGCALVHLSFHDDTIFGGHLSGGLLGEVLGEVLRSLLGLVGAYVVGLAVVLITLVLRTSFSIVEATRTAATTTKKAGASLANGAKTMLDAWREARELEQKERAEQARLLEPKITPFASEIGPEEVAIAGEFSQEAPKKTRARKARPETDTAHDLPAPVEAVVMPEPARPRGKKIADDGPVIVAPVAQPIETTTATSLRAPDTKVVPSSHKEFVLPPPSLLDPVPAVEVHIDEKQLKDHAAKLVEKLQAYGVQGRVDEIHPGPVVTMYELEPASGTKVSKIASLADDLAMALAAQKVRIVAPIPGKARVGFELPNPKRQTVSIREILEDERWQSTKHALPMALGKDIAGQPVYVDMAKMPHLLVAGATGAGKSVGLNVMLASLLTKRTPEEVRLLMIDPKVVELAVFDGIPHMLLPVVTDMKKANLALRWAVDEMERRYQLFADAGARNITTYNERVEKVHRGELSAEALAPKRVGKVRAQGAEGEEVLIDPDDGETPDAIAMPDKLPYIVVVVDEFADLMMVAAKDVEAAIARLAQKARAAGIHVILATQRPSVDVITGMIKANFPSRIAFKVAQREDSKTILGRNGAEHLLGMGDMLMIPPGAADLKRVHCAYISEDEVKAVCDFLRAQAKPVYDENILKPRDEEDGGEGGEVGGGGSSDDPMYDRAVAIVAQAGYCSISHLQRHLSVGYNKAAKLVEKMEKEGVVGPASAKAGGRREVLVQAL